jgi:hypothetical protein
MEQDKEKSAFQGLTRHPLPIFAAHVPDLKARQARRTACLKTSFLIQVIHGYL